jgi:isochorismate pyruvate lyase
LPAATRARRGGFRAVAKRGRAVQTSVDENGRRDLSATTTGAGKAPAECQSKEDVRTEIDRIDQALLTLFAERHAYVTRMAEIKTDPHEAFDKARIEAIVTKQRARALALDLDEDQAELIWRTLIDWNVNYEKGIIAARRRN